MKSHREYNTEVKSLRLEDKAKKVFYQKIANALTITRKYQKNKKKITWKNQK